ncbi:MAG: SIMPL domain-containing protein [Firmicutes bacterium]|nr:SIMPL domain-containing protein [Bacillota bacterium]
MARTITVKGTGNISVSPDYVIISMSLKSVDKDYEKALELAANKIENLNKALERIGFENKSVKTTTFNVQTEYDSVRDSNGNYKRVFEGYSCNHRLKVEFDFDTKLLAQSLSAISKYLAEPEISISFTVKDKAAVDEELLKSAAVNAKNKAQILCDASGVKLGDLINIDYNWGELNIYSQTDYCLEEKCMTMPVDSLADIEIEPDDIKVNDSVTFVWEIK